MKKLILLAVCIFPMLSVSLAQPRIGSSILEIIDIETGERTVVREFPYIIEAPNWTPDNKWLVFNSRGKMYKISPYNPEEYIEIYTGFATACNNDHVLSLDGKQLAISHVTSEDRKSRIYTLPFEGGYPTLITPLAPSYLHGWSPCGKYLAYCAERNGEFDVYIIPAIGGVEIRLTDAPGLDDGPEYSPCGEYIWFNSERTGLMQVWKMKADGSQQTQMSFHDDLNSWFPHISPDGEKIAYISYRKDDVAPGAHPPNRQVQLRLMSAQGGNSRLLANLFGGQGTINVNSWAPDNRRFAFVSYRLFGTATDVGNCAFPGKTVYDNTDGSYTMTGSGANMWGRVDAFHYAWSHIQGDFSLTADIAFEGPGVNPHRKIGIRLSETLDEDSPCVFVAIHGDGLTALQYRETKGDITKSKVSQNRAPTRIQLSRRGNNFEMRTWSGDQMPEEPDAELTLEMPNRAFFGLYVCARDNTVSETAKFSNIRLVRGN